MVSFTGFLLIYLTGGLTFLPLVILFAIIYNKGGIQTLLPRPKSKPEAYVYKDPDTVIVKKGWVRITNQYQPKMPDINTNPSGIISGIQSYVSKEQQKKGLVYAVLKHGKLFCFESEKQQEVVMILPIQDFSVSLYPPHKQDAPEGLIYSRTVVVRLVPNTVSPHDTDKPSVCTLPEEDITVNPNRVLYLTCGRNIDKEDWYLGLVEAQHVLTDSNNKDQYVMMDNTHFDPESMEELIRLVQSSPSHRETAWLNAVFGRLFLAIYKTDRLKDFVENKIRKKIDKTKRPTFLEEITVRKVDVGGSLPFITDPRLLSLSPQGEVIVEAKVEYHGGLTIEIETDFNWSYSSLMKPIRMHLVLSVNLKKLAGRMMFKLKSPPTNRYWLAFFEMPEMEWKITPIVADKQIKLSIVTNAIESRIREVMAETFVLPNMDDTSFCPSGGKGGIFGDYIKVKQKKRSNTEAFVHQDQKLKPDDSHLSRQNSASSEHSNVRDTPTVPDVAEKSSASDALKLPARHAESVTDLTLGATKKTDGVELEISHSTPDMHVAPLLEEQHSPSTASFDRKSIAESTHSTGSNKWQTTGSYIRKRMNKGTDEEHSDSESVKSNKSSNQSGFFNKISNMLPTDNASSVSDNVSLKSASSTGSNKRTSLIHMAENFLAKKTNAHEELLNEEKKSMYAERIANMRKRAGEKLTSMSNISPPLPPPPSPPVAQYPSSSKHLLDEEVSESERNTLPSLQPRRERAASTVHGDSSSSLSKPPLPPRRNSTPIPVSDELHHTSSAQDVHRYNVNEASISEEPDVDLDTNSSDEKPPLPTAPRPVQSHTTPDLPSRESHSPPAIPLRHS